LKIVGGNWDGEIGRRWCVEIKWWGICCGVQRNHRDGGEYEMADEKH
jgi:hypothetical protein